MLDPETIRQREIVTAALNRAEEIRRFEIGLYWRRALYFWGFNVAIFTGVGVFMTASAPDQPNLLIEVTGLLLALLGLFVTIAWWFMSEGSKAWQENWEEHVYFLEDDVTGRLMKTQFVGKSRFFSVSKINKCVIFVIGLFWGAVAALLGARLIKRSEAVMDALQDYWGALAVAAVCVFILGLVALVLACCRWRSDLYSDSACCKTRKDGCKGRTLTPYQRPTPNISCGGGDS